MLAYGAIGVLAGLTAGHGTALVTANLPYFQGSLGLSAVEAAWIPAVYVMTNLCANLVLVKCRQQFGLVAFLKWVMLVYLLTAVGHLFIHEFWSAILIRAASGFAAAGLVTLSVLCLLQAFPAPKRLLGIMIGISVPQLAIPIARMLAPTFLDWGEWSLAYYFEIALAVLTLAALVALPLPPSEREKVFEPADLLTVAFLFPGISLLCAVLGLGRIMWWTEAEWIGWALVASILLITAGLTVEHRRANPLLVTRWLARREIIRIAVIAMSVRVLLSEHSFGSIGLLTTLGMGTDQFQLLYLVVTLASIAGLVTAVLAFSPPAPARLIQIACLCIALGAWLDSGATNLTRPADLYLSQGLVGFGALLFVGPAMLIGISRMFLSGTRQFISWIVLFSASQNFGGLIGSAFFGTFQTIREKYHSHNLVEQVLLTDPHVAGRFADSARQLGGVIADPAQRSAQGAGSIARQVTQEANILAYNDVFMVIATLALFLFFWGVFIELRMRRIGEPSPIVLLGQLLAARSASLQQGKPA
jgi:MFS family permease